jgi:hypothetical protein
MNTVINEPKNKFPLVRMLREYLEHRALWMYFLCDEARKKGLDPEKFAPEAIRRCGLYHGLAPAEWHDAQGPGQSLRQSLKHLKKTRFKLRGRLIFEMKIRRLTDDNFDVDFHYCPLVKAWQKQNCSVEEMDRLCDFAMWGDRGIAESYGCDLELNKTIAKGDGVCEIRFKRKKPETP